MTRLSLPIQTIAPERFAPYGDILELTSTKPSEEDEFNRFQIITRSQEPTGWRLAVLRFTNHETRRLEQHPNSKESFEPVSGVAVICLAAPDTPNQVEAFLLDKPVCLDRGVWHDVFAISDEAVVKITENLEVDSVFHELERPLAPRLVG